MTIILITKKVLLRVNLIHPCALNFQQEHVNLVADFAIC